MPCILLQLRFMLFAGQLHDQHLRMPAGSGSSSLRRRVLCWRSQQTSVLVKSLQCHPPCKECHLCVAAQLRSTPCQAGKCRATSCHSERLQARGSLLKPDMRQLSWSSSLSGGTACCWHCKNRATGSQVKLLKNAMQCSCCSTIVTLACTCTFHLLTCFLVPAAGP